MSHDGGQFRVPRHQCAERSRPRVLGTDRGMPGVDHHRHPRLGQQAPHLVEPRVVRREPAHLQVHLEDARARVKRRAHVAGHPGLGVERRRRQAPRVGPAELQRPWPPGFRAGSVSRPGLARLCVNVGHVQTVSDRAKRGVTRHRRGDARGTSPPAVSHPCRWNDMNAAPMSSGRDLLRHPRRQGATSCGMHAEDGDTSDARVTEVRLQPGSGSVGRYALSPAGRRSAP